MVVAPGKTSRTRAYPCAWVTVRQLRAVAPVTGDVHRALPQLEEGGGVSERSPGQRGEARGGELTMEGDQR
jgi:hypothetical protein